MLFCKYNKINNIGKMGIEKNFTIVGTLRLDCEKLQLSWSQWKAAVRSLQNSHIAVMVKFCLCLCVQKKSGKKKLFYLQCILLSRQQKLSLRNQLYMSHISNEVVNVWVSSLKITVGHRTMSDQIRKLSDQTENIPYILSNRKIWSKIKC